ncbi:MAG: hypothetical protein JST16_07455 [Bdellovibrionales bacterium]|nr:hypothetical protein [Bdellovibrionales bacterium]
MGSALRASMLAILLTACGQSDLSTSFDAAARKQSDIDNMTLSLWKRSPIVDSGNSSVTASTDLDTIPRTSLVFSGLTGLKSAVASSEITVYESSSSKQAPTFYEWAGLDVPTTNSDFQILMSYYHATKAKDHAKNMFTDVNFAATGNAVLPLTVYAMESGSVTASNYDPSAKTIQLYHDAKGALPNFRIADEADAVYHEFGHAVQDALNHTAINTAVAAFLDVYPANRDLDSILEGLADVDAAAVAQDDTILPYLSANLPSFLPTNYRTGNAAYRRSTRNTLKFPNAYVRQAHLDGRVISGALNDFRRVLAGETVTEPPGCTSSCTSLKLTANTVSSTTAFDRMMELGYRAYQQASTTVTFFQFANLLLDRCDNDSNVGTWCGDDATVRAALVSILDGRGLKSSSMSANNATILVGVTAGTIGSATGLSPAASGSPDVRFGQLGFMPFPNDTGFANTDSELNPCEVVLIYPNMVNVNATESIFDITVVLTGISGFTNLVPSGSTTPVETVTTSPSKKILGWLAPGESSDSLVNFYTGNSASRWYDAQNGAYLTQKLSSTYYPSELGWIVRAPNSYATSASATFQIYMRRYNASATSSYLIQTVTQSLTTSATGTESFCTAN